MSSVRNTIRPAPAAQTPGAGPGVAHELSNLLDGAMRSVGLALMTLQERDADPAALSRLAAAQDNLRRMTTLLKLWMRGGSDQGVDRLFWRDAMLGVIITHALRMLDAEATQRQVTLTADVDDKVRAMPAGPVMQVIVNGLRNAMEAVGRDGEVMLIARREAADVVILIFDNGPGVPLDPKRDADGLLPVGESTKRGGHGIGLALSRQIIQSIGGGLSLTNRPEGGAELRVRFPAPPEPPEPSER